MNDRPINLDELVRAVIDIPDKDLPEGAKALVVGIWASDKLEQIDRGRKSVHVVKLPRALGRQAASKRS